jgi:hypothetical protein
MAPLWEYQRVKRMTFRYVPAVPTTTTGILMAGIDYDPDDTLSDLASTEALVRTLGAHEGTVDAPVWQELAVTAYDKPERQALFTDNSDLDSDNRFLALGRYYLVVASSITFENGSTAGSLGDIFIDYEIEFSVPQLDEHIEDQTAAICIAQASNTAGTGPASYVNSAFNPRIGALAGLLFAWYSGDTNAIIDTARDSSLISALGSGQLIQTADGNTWFVVVAEYFGALNWHTAAMAVVPTLQVVTSNNPFGYANATAVGVVGANDSFAGTLDTSCSGVPANNSWKFRDNPAMYSATVFSYNGSTVGLPINSAFSGMARQPFCPPALQNDVGANSSFYYNNNFVTLSTNDGLHCVGFMFDSNDAYIQENATQTNPFSAYFGLSTYPDPPTRPTAGIFPLTPSVVEVKKAKNLRRRAASLRRCGTLHPGFIAAREKFGKISHLQPLTPEWCGAARSLGLLVEAGSIDEGLRMARASAAKAQDDYISVSNPVLASAVSALRRTVASSSSSSSR